VVGLLVIRGILLVGRPKSKEEAIALLKAVEGVEDVQITIRPSWLSTVPALKDKVQITVE